MPFDTDRLMARIDSMSEDLIQLTQDLVRIPSLNPPGELYRDVCDYLDKRLTRHGFDTQMLRAHGTPGDCDKYPAWNIVARKEGSHPGECIHFNSHVDVVEVGQGWTFDPFGGEVSDGKIYGRGTCDMKGGLATSIIAAEAFIAEFPDFHGAIEISGSAGEESGGYGGVGFLAHQGFFSPQRVQHVIIPEPLHKDRICLGHRGGWWAEIETMGEIAHGCMPFLGDCAVRHMGAVMDRFEKDLFPAMAARHTEMPVVPASARSSTMNINSIHGGQPEYPEGSDALPTHCVPDSCRIVIDRRYLAEESYEDVKGEVTAILDDLVRTRDSFSYNLRELNHVPPSMTDRQAPIVTTVHRAITEVLGTTPEYVASPGTYDQKHVDRIGKLRNCIAYGPGLLEMAHKPDEYVGIQDMIDGAKVMAHSLSQLLLPNDAD